MELKYTESEIKSAIDFFKKNPNLEFEDWIIYNNDKPLTLEEKEYFKYIEMCEVVIPLKNKSSKLSIINWNGVGGGWFREPFLIFIKKWFSEDACRFINGNYDEKTLVVDDNDFFDFDNYDLHEEIEDLYIKSFDINDVNITILNGTYVGRDCDDHRKYYDIVRDLERNSYWVWDESNWRVFIRNYNKINYKPVLTFFDKK